MEARCAKRDAELRPHIQRVFGANWQVYGVRKVCGNCDARTKQLAERQSGRGLHASFLDNRKIASISTVIRPGSEATPMAERACCALVPRIL